MRIAAAALLLGIVAPRAPAQSTIRVPEERPTIQAAINIAPNGCEIIVAPGIYKEAINFLGKPVQLRSVGGAGVTTIDAMGLGTAVRCGGAEGPGTVLNGFTIRGGNAQFGGGILNAGSPMVVNCIIFGNVAYGSPGGAGMYNSGNPLLINCVFIWNSVTNAYPGGGLYNAGGHPSLINCTFYGNGTTWNQPGAAIYNSGGTLTVTNSIFWSNNSPNPLYLCAGYLTYCDVQGGFSGLGNFNADPQFVNAASGNLRLLSSSPCNNSGNNFAVPVDVLVDLDGNPRINGRDTPPRVDMGPYEFQFVVSDFPPIANAGLDQVVLPGSRVTLDGSGSLDDNTATPSLLYAWTCLEAPAPPWPDPIPPQAIRQEMVTGYTTRLAGTYVFQLVVWDSSGQASEPDEIVIIAKPPPTANAGEDRLVRIGESALLSGASSGGDPLNFAWRWFSTPEGSTAVLDPADAMQCTFVPDLPGFYVAELTVNDGLASSTATVTITADDPPIANAGEDRSIRAGQLVTLDGTQSTDVDTTGVPLSYLWEWISKPLASGAELDAPTSPTPFYLADVAGEYIIGLTVTDGLGQWSTDEVMITTDNLVAIPVIGGDDVRSAWLGELVELDGSQSHDPEGWPLFFRWSFADRPQGSQAALSDPSNQWCSFIPDVRGSYVVELEVDDLLGWSLPDQVTVIVANRVPIASIIANPPAPPIGEMVTLSAQATDADADPLHYSWAMVRQPPGSSVELTDDDVNQCTFRAMVSGDYSIELTVSDGIEAVRATVDVTTDNPPIAKAGDDQALHWGVPVMLDGRGSEDENTSTLTFLWTLYRPAGSFAELNDPTSSTPSFLADVDGDYTVTLVVTDEWAQWTEDQVLISSNNIAPVAIANSNATGYLIGDTVSLDGSESSDPDWEAGWDDPIYYTWLLEAPAGSIASLDDNAAMKPSFVADVPGTYTVYLIVDDGCLFSEEAAQVVVTVITGEQFVENTAVVVIAQVEALPAAAVTTAGNKNAFKQFMVQTIEGVQTGDLALARMKLLKAMERTDGYLRDTVDINGPGRDWITDKSEQAKVYPKLKSALDAIAP